MRLAWFRPAALDADHPLDDTGALVAALGDSHQIDVITPSSAHDFVWMQYRRPYDLCVFELDNTAAHQFIWPYLLHYGGVTMLRTLMLNESRAAALVLQRRNDDYRAELEFSRDWRLLRAPLLASRSVVVSHEAIAETLASQYPETPIRHAPVGVRGCEGAKVRGCEGAKVRVGVLDSNRLDIVQSAFDRARQAGVDVSLLVDAPPERILHDADIIIAVRWPAVGEPERAALAAMAAGKAVVVMETEVTADWPAYDPQTWRPRGRSGERPVVVSVDPRDEEHSLMVAIRDLARDRQMRESLGEAAHAWWKTHATVEHAAAAWGPILEEARNLQPPARPGNWPAHLTADGTEDARAILAETGATVDFL